MFNIYFSDIFWFFFGVLNSATRGSDQSLLLFDAKTLVLKMNSPPSPPRNFLSPIRRCIGCAFSTNVFIQMPFQ